MNSSEQLQVPPSIILHEMLGGYGKSQLIFVAAKLGLADHLASGTQNAYELAKVVKADPDAFYRFLRALATLGLVEEIEPQHFILTPVGAYLQTQTPDSLHTLVRWAEEVEMKMWGYLEQCVRTGQSAFEHAYGIGMFEYFQRNPDKETLFSTAMTSFVSRNRAGIVGAYPFEPFLKIVDVGGGQGSLMTEILRANPETTGVVFDVPSVVEEAKRYLESVQLTGRCQCVGGDFFKAVPAGGDVYLLVSILHDWDDERCITILKNCRLAMSNQARLLIAEMVIPPGTEPAFAKLFDMAMLVLTSGGRERTEAEFQKLLAEAGFNLAKVIPTTSTVSIIEANPV
ncbi:MAG: methyltransferase [Gammaproteobacteria bacterium]|nr:methyltransferase [Gammaproteobacteria bacterium]MCP5423589.1 methyltransferase [Gammaproteobacteria bacterium]MCP5459833.1 methyltransferase [Gammaproteobacteria bacterium]